MSIHNDNDNEKNHIKTIQKALLYYIRVDLIRKYAVESIMIWLPVMVAAVYIGMRAMCINGIILLLTMFILAISFDLMCTHSTQIIFSLFKNGCNGREIPKADIEMDKGSVHTIDVIGSGAEFLSNTGNALLVTTRINNNDVVLMYLVSTNNV